MRLYVATAYVEPLVHTRGLHTHLFLCALVSAVEGGGLAQRSMGAWGRGRDTFATQRSGCDVL